MVLTHRGRASHICVGKLTIIGSDNGLSPRQRLAIIWTNAGILIIRPLGTNVSKILIGIQTFSLRKMHLKISSAKWRPFCLGLNELNKRAFVSLRFMQPFAAIIPHNVCGSSFWGHLQDYRPTVQLMNYVHCLFFVMFSWWPRGIDRFSVLLSHCAGNPPSYCLSAWLNLWTKNRVIAEIRCHDFKITVHHKNCTLCSCFVMFCSGFDSFVFTRILQR